jgi:hypothetical protein
VAATTKGAIIVDTPIHFAHDFGLNSKTRGVEFTAHDGARQLLCVITENTLARYFGAVHHGTLDSLRAFEENREDIQAIAAAMIRAGRADADNVLRISSAYVAAHRAE